MIDKLYLYEVSYTYRSEISGSDVFYTIERATKSFLLKDKSLIDAIGVINKDLCSTLRDVDINTVRRLDGHKVLGC